MDAKKVAMAIAIVVLLPLFVGLFTDAVYEEPKYEDYCVNDYGKYAYPAHPQTMTDSSDSKINTSHCKDTSDLYMTSEVQKCYNERGIPEFGYDEDGCQKFELCNYCSKEFDDARQKYNRNIFFILLPLGLLIIILGIYLAVDYLGAGLMFAGLIVMFYATLRYFSDMSKILRAVVILIELLVILWIGYKKIEHRTDPFQDMKGALTGKLNKSRNLNTIKIKKKKK
jgi:hypothetical protein